MFKYPKNNTTLFITIHQWRYDAMTLCRYEPMFYSWLAWPPVTRSLCVRQSPNVKWYEASSPWKTPKITVSPTYATSTTSICRTSSAPPTSSTSSTATSTPSPWSCCPTCGTTGCLHASRPRISRGQSKLRSYWCARPCNCIGQRRCNSRGLAWLKTSGWVPTTLKGRCVTFHYPLSHRWADDLAVIDPSIILTDRSGLSRWQTVQISS